MCGAGCTTGKYYPFMIDEGSTNSTSENKKSPSNIKESVCNVLQGDQNDQDIFFPLKSDVGDADININLINKFRQYPRESNGLCHIY